MNIIVKLFNFFFYFFIPYFRALVLNCMQHLLRYLFFSPIGRRSSIEFICRGWNSWTVIFNVPFIGFLLFILLLGCIFSNAWLTTNYYLVSFALKLLIILYFHLLGFIKVLCYRNSHLVTLSVHFLNSSVTYLNFGFSFLNNKFKNKNLSVKYTVIY